MKRQQRSHLSRCIKNQIAHQRVNSTDAALQFGISKSYLSQLLNGEKSFRHVDENVLRKMAMFLNISAAACFMLAGKLTMRDFALKDGTYERVLNHAIDTVARSHFATESGVTDEELHEAPESMQVLVIQLYQHAVVKIITEHGLNDFIWFAPKREL